jgi:hypothetical protein
MDAERKPVAAIGRGHGALDRRGSLHAPLPG